MTQTEEFIKHLECLKEGERSRLRRLAGQPLDATLPGFDLFTGLWWPLREKSTRAPRRETSWLIAKLYGAYPIPHVRREGRDERRVLPHLLGRCEPRADAKARQRYRCRFDALLESPLSALEPHLHWALSRVAEEVAHGRLSGLDWVQLLDELSAWDRAGASVRDRWARQYLRAAT